jgi:hypothetical protein
VLSDFERAIAYFTLPGIREPLPAWVYALFIGALAVFLAVFAGGVRAESDAATMTGGIGLAVTTLAALAVFFGHAIRAEIREREALAEAAHMPNAESGFEASLDPFADHRLFGRPRNKRADDTAIWDRKGNVVMHLRLDVEKAGWRVLDAQEQDDFQIRVEKGSISFSVEGGAPKSAEAVRGGGVVARVTREWTWGRDRVRAELVGSESEIYKIEHGEIQYDGDIVGRIYYIKRSCYLDVTKSHVNEAILTYFLALT